MKYLALLLSFILCACAEKPQPHPSFGEFRAVEHDYETKSVSYLDQNWDNTQRKRFWYTSQGSRFVPYMWYAYLEQADSQAWFNEPEHIESMRYIPMSRSPENRGALPLGFAVTIDKQTQDAWMGFTCAACHTAKVEFEGRPYLVEGGPTMGNWHLFFSELIGALEVTYRSGKEDGAKFARFANNLYGPEKNTESMRSELLRDMKNVIDYLNRHERINQVGSTPGEDHYGFGRIDAFGIIQNAASVLALDDEGNINEPNAPVSYPFLWGAHQSNVVQWNGALPNDVFLGPLARNSGEVIGVLGRLAIEENPWWWSWVPGQKLKYQGSIDFANLGDIEVLLRDLRSPSWPGEIDHALAERGREIYFDQEIGCVRCHQYVPRENEGELYKANLIPAAIVGTDPLMTEQANSHMARSGILEGQRVAILKGPKFAEIEPAIKFSFNGTFGLMLKEPVTVVKAGLKSGQKSSSNLEPLISEPTNDDQAELTLERAFNDYIQATSTLQAEGPVYKARPLTGIWATAPYLHNGSVPNLHALLQHPDDRPSRFWVGSRKIDTVNVGLVSHEGLEQFQVRDENNRIIPGNSNAGHDMASGLTEEQKLALLEFLKTL
ncbi:(7S,10S)-hydroperoxide diol synthase [Aurantivibrio plasticivorans]